MRHSEYIKSKKELAVILSKLRVFEKPKMMEEQYTLDPDVSADILWNAYMRHDIQWKEIADFGCGTGILGIGALLLGAKKVYFIDNDTDVFPNLLENIKTISDCQKKVIKKIEILNLDIRDFSKKTDVVIMNPPFGTKVRYLDKDFFKKAFSTADVVIGINKAAKLSTVEKIANENNYRILEIKKYLINLKKTMKEHLLKSKVVPVVCIRAARKPL